MVRIKKFQGTLLNSKSEWNAPPIVRIIAQNENERNQEKLKNNASNQINSVQPTPLNRMVWRGLIGAESSPETVPNCQPQQALTNTRLVEILVKIVTIVSK